MSAEIIPFPQRERFVAILGGTGSWYVTVAFGDRTDQAYQGLAQMHPALADAQSYAAQVAAYGDWPVRLMPCSGPENAA